MTLGIVGVLTSLAVPSLRNLTLTNRMSGEVNTLMSSLYVTRSEAIKRGQPITLCPSGDGRTCADAGSDYTWWHHGILVFVDINDNDRLDDGETLVRAHRMTGDNLTIKTSRFRRSVKYQPNGFSSGTNPTFAFCDRRGAGSVRYVIVSNTGRPRVSTKSDSGLSCP
ncbi:MAG: GspH/FimT family pseudopilin [Gammaproteobacteria bacterium]|nr:GspH/FimT family pseudopilin [Gammaproteobacteria bacterium]